MSLTYRTRTEYRSLFSQVLKDYKHNPAVRQELIERFKADDVHEVLYYLSKFRSRDQSLDALLKFKDILVHNVCA